MYYLRCQPLHRIRRPPAISPTANPIMLDIPNILPTDLLSNLRNKLLPGMYEAFILSNHSKWTFNSPWTYGCIWTVKRILYRCTGAMLRGMYGVHLVTTKFIHLIIQSGHWTSNKKSGRTQSSGIRWLNNSIPEY